MTANDPFNAREVRGRRGGHVKAPLTRDLVVSEALRQLKEDGLAGMSLRKIALALETGPASLYVYVDDLDALHALVLDRALADVDVSGGRHRAWRERIKAVLTSYARVLFASRGLAQLALGTVAVGPNALRILDALLGMLSAGGVAPNTAAWAVDLLVLYVTAIAAERSERADPGDPVGPIAQALARAPSETYPHLHA
ncbi:TetR/AcrR family transcriptional regulator, partial [bacterium]